MRLLRALVTRLKEPLFREQLNSDLVLELDTHLQMLTEDNIRAGLLPEEAHRRARLALGGMETVKENCRDRMGFPLFDSIARDVRYALRALRQRPGFAAVAILTLGLGIGATTVMFTVINGVLLKPLPYPEPERLVSLNERTEKATQFGNLVAFTYPNFLDCMRESKTLDMAAWGYRGGTLSRPGAAEYVDGFEISWRLFSVLGVAAAQGRTFVPDDDRAGATPVSIISYELWQRRFGGSKAALGTTLVFEAKPYTVVGVAPAGFQLSQQADIYLPLGQDSDPILRNRSIHRIHAVARLQPGATLFGAQAELEGIGRRLAEQYPASNAGRSMVAALLRPNTGEVGSTLWLLLGAVSLVMLIAFVNVASLLMARAVAREREIAMRAALGVSRSRLVRQCLTESVVLAVCGGGLGLLIAATCIHPFILMWPGSLPRAESVHLDWHVMLFTLGASLLSGILFGLAPAMRAPVRELEQTLRAGGRTVAGSSRRLHSVFVMSEIALAVVLLVSAGILGRAMLRLNGRDPGVKVQDVLVARAALSPQAFASPGLTRSQWQDLLERIRRVPGVEAVATVDTVPMREGYNQLGYSTTAAIPPANEQPLALATSVTPDYLQVMGIPLRAGRFFSTQDRLESEPVVVIDDVFARSAFGGQSAVGKRVWIPNMDTRPVQVIGVVGHVRHWGLANDDDAQVRAQFYYPFAQVPDQLLRRWSQLMSIAVRTRVEPLSLVQRLRREASGANGDQVLYEVHTMEELARASLARQRFLLLLFGIFAAVALLLAAIGIYGVLAYLTSQRVPEIGVHMALGASAADVVSLVLRQSVGMIFGGVMVGVLAAVGAARLLERLVDGVGPPDPMTFAAMVLMLVVVATIASYLPARGASRLEPMTALRQE